MSKLTSPMPSPNRINKEGLFLRPFGLTHDAAPRRRAHDEAASPAHQDAFQQLQDFLAEKLTDPADQEKAHGMLVQLLRTAPSNSDPDDDTVDDEAPKC